MLCLMEGWDKFKTGNEWLYLGKATETYLNIDVNELTIVEPHSTEITDTICQEIIKNILFKKIDSWLEKNL